jgi:tetratricopeptide (TPR) repeat protein
LQEDPKYALAKYRLGKLYETQKSYEIMLENYEEAIKLDPVFAPAYLSMYEYYSYRDVDKAKEYLDKYIANTDADCQTALFAADYLFRSGKYNEALSKSNQLQAGNCASEIGLRLKVLNAYCYERLKDSVNAKPILNPFYNKSSQKNSNFRLRNSSQN